MALLTIFLAITGSTLLMALIYLVIASLIFWLIWWFISWIGVPEPFNKPIKVVIALAAIIVIISILLGLVGRGFIHF